MADPGMPIPRDFDEAMRLALQADTEGKFRPRAVGDLLGYFNQGLGGVLYRFVSCTEQDEAFTANVTANGEFAGFPARYHQERDLFDFVVNGQSAVECLCFALHAIGAMIDPGRFLMATEADLRRVSPELTRHHYHAAFVGQGITRSLDGTIGSAEYREWKDVRNLLSHRVHPGRVYSVGGPPAIPPTAWSGIAINVDTTRTRRTWLAAQITDLLREAHAFVVAQP